MIKSNVHYMQVCFFFLLSLLYSHFVSYGNCGYMTRIGQAWPYVCNAANAVERWRERGREQSKKLINKGK